MRKIDKAIEMIENDEYFREIYLCNSSTTDVNMKEIINVLCPNELGMNEYATCQNVDEETCTKCWNEEVEGTECKNETECKSEAVNHPSHYNKGIETIDYIESWNMNFNEGNAIKYITRAKYKNNELEDLKKARFYLDRLIGIAENKGE